MYVTLLYKYIYIDSVYSVCTLSLSALNCVENTIQSRQSYGGGGMSALRKVRHIYTDTGSYTVLLVNVA